MREIKTPFVTHSAVDEKEAIEIETDTKLKAILIAKILKMNKDDIRVICGPENKIPSNDHDLVRKIMREFPLNATSEEYADDEYEEDEAVSEDDEDDVDLCSNISNAPDSPAACSSFLDEEAVEDNEVEESDEDENYTSCDEEDMEPINSKSRVCDLLENFIPSDSRKRKFMENLELRTSSKVKKY